MFAWLKKKLGLGCGGCSSKASSTSQGGAPADFSTSWPETGGAIHLGASDAPYWMPLPGLSVRLLVRPLTQAVSDVARAKAMAAIRALREHVDAVKEDGGRVLDLPDLDDEATRVGLAEFEYCVALAEAAIIGWDNVFMAGDDAAVVSPAAIRQLMSVNTVGERFRTAYTAGLREVEAEKKGSGAGPNGISEPAPQYCGQCRELDLPCSRGERVGGKLCPYVEHAPRTPDGAAAWGAMLACRGHMLSDAEGAAIGLDMVACLTYAQALGASPGALAALLPAIDLGLLDAAAKDDGDD